MAYQPDLDVAERQGVWRRFGDRVLQHPGLALGIDYTIFLMSRVREKARTYGTREGVLRALSATGPVITNAGLILAGTFSVLMTLLGDRIWWPSTARGGGHTLREHAEAEDDASVPQLAG